MVVISRCAEFLVPAETGQKKRFGPRYIDVNASIDSVALALGQSRQEILHMSELVRGMLDDLWTGMRHNDARLIRLVAERDDRVDLLDHHVKRFLTKVVRSITSERDAAEQMQQLRYASEFLGGAFPDRRSRAYAKRAAQAQDALGRLNDLVQARELLSVLADRIGLDEKGAVASAAGFVLGWAARDADDALEAVASSWRRLRNSEPFWR
ncbi:MAG: CHAD domain-containing protein [Candidatus Poseidoniia archaeon]